MSKRAPKAQSKNKGQPSPLSVFILAIFAFIFGAPIGLVLFLAGVGLIVWRVQKAANKMTKLPPLPPREDEFDPTGTTFPPLPHELETKTSNDGLSDSAWGRTDAPPAPRPVERKPEPVPVWSPTPTRDTVAVSTYQPPLPVPTRSAPISSNAYRDNPKRRPSGLGINLATEAGLRQAVIAMTVLGPCRASSPYEEESSIAGKQLAAQDRQRRPHDESSPL